MAEEDFPKIEEVQKMEQGMALIADSFPGMWRRMYLNLVDQGFLPFEAMDLLKTYISANCQPQK